MFYTTIDLAKKTGYTTTSVVHILNAAGYSACDRGDFNLKLWDESALEFLFKKRADSEKVDTFSIQSLADTFQISRQDVRSLLTEMGIKPICPDAVKQMEYYPAIARLRLKDYFSAVQTAKDNDHPLVKDKNCLKLSWFPPTVPSCFEDLDD